MKPIILIAFCMGAAQLSIAQLHSGTKAVPPTAQPVPASSATEKSAPTPKPLIAPAANPIPPIYPGAEAKVVETQRETVFPAAPPSPTQPVQREPLTPIDATNVLQPARPPREEASRPLSPSTPVQRTSRPTGIEQAKLSGETAPILNPQDRKPIVTRKTNAPSARTNRKVAKDKQLKLMSSEKQITKKKMNSSKKYKKNKSEYRKK